MSRIYLVADTDAPTGDRRLVRAGSRAEAIKHVTGKRFQAWVPDQEELADAILDGVKIETPAEASSDASDEQQAATGSPA